MLVSSGRGPRSRLQLTPARSSFRPVTVYSPSAQCVLFGSLATRLKACQRPRVPASSQGPALLGAHMHPSVIIVAIGLVRQCRVICLVRRYVSCAAVVSRGGLYREGIGTMT